MRVGVARALGSFSLCREEMRRSTKTRQTSRNNPPQLLSSREKKERPELLEMAAVDASGIVTSQTVGLPAVRFTAAPRGAFSFRRGGRCEPIRRCDVGKEMCYRLCAVPPRGCQNPSQEPHTDGNLHKSKKRARHKQQGATHTSIPGWGKTAFNHP